MKKLFAFLLISAGVLAQAPVVPVAPVWFKVAAGGDTITATKGMVFRYGANASTYVFACPLAEKCGTHQPGDASAAAWSAPTPTVTDGPFLAGDDFFGGDPVYDVYKEVDIQETASPQTVTVTPAGSSTPVTVTVPALAAVNDPGAVVTATWSGSGVPCWHEKVAAKNPNGSAGKTYDVQICGPVD